jgi:exodeoxyribonuclease-3
MRAKRARLLCWNVNGLRACAKQGFRAWLRQCGAEIVGIQEVRARIYTDLGRPRFDEEGRLQMARFGRLVLANVYFPNGNGKDRDNSRVPFKLAFYRALFDRLQRMRKGGYRVLVMGSDHCPVGVDVDARIFG